MLSEWVERVGREDQILHLGDVAIHRKAHPVRWLSIISYLPGEKFLILGNHDNDKNLGIYEDAGFTIVPEFVYQGIAFSHRPVCEDRYDDEGNDWSVNIHGHTHSNEYNPEHDGILLGDRRYINVCVERTNLAPVRLGNIYPI